ncbi:MAG: ABC transporter permease [Candidatus Aenigmatarchaeota archaeon]
MRLNKVFALIYHDMLVFARAKWRIMDMFYFPITTILVWGLFAEYMKTSALEAGLIVLALNIFWNFAVVAQSNTNMQMMDDAWSGSIKQFFVSGIREAEYITARVIFTTGISLVLLAILMLISYYFFDLRIIFERLDLMIYLSFLTLLSSIAMSIVIAAILLNAGKEYGFLAWTLLQIFILLSAPFYPTSLFPNWLQPIASVMPYTAIFENARLFVTRGSLDATLLVNGFLISLSYLLVSLPLYFYAFRRARKTGYLAKLGN